jgi:drug/metabolite transporter (DMT)-like permease
MRAQNTGLGIWLMITTTLVFSVQDVFSRALAQEYNVMMVLMIRFWFFGAFAVWLVARSPGGLRQVRGTRHLRLQILRGVILAVEIVMMVTSFVVLGLVASHAAFTAYPLAVAALSGPLLGEKVGWRRWVAIGIGFVGVLVILRPGQAVFSVWALLPLGAALLFAVYSLLTRYVSRDDPTGISFFWTGVTTSLLLTLGGIWFWQPMTTDGWAVMAGLCLLGALGHWLLIRAYEVAEASAIQPFAYFQLVFITLIGVGLLGETVDPEVIVGTLIVVAAGLFTLWRARLREKVPPTDGAGP